MEIEFRNVSKSFGSVHANAGVTFSVARGTIHGLIGENGAGKSTAMKLLYGMYPYDSGEIRLRGKKVEWHSAMDAIRAGVGMVHQHFMLAEPNTALDNIIVGVESVSKHWKWLPRFAQPIDRKAARVRIEALMTQYGLHVDLDATVESLPVGVQQRLEILKLLYRDAEILILDEPTAVLTPQETEDLFKQLKRLKEEGKTILIITHKLKEVLAVTDQVTVMRAGKVTGNVKTSETDVHALAEMMVGRSVMLQVEKTPPTPGESVLKLKNFTCEALGLKNLSLDLRAGEILGIAGVEGNGQSELLDVLLHPNEAHWNAGEIEFLGQSTHSMNCYQLRSQGVGIISEDRHQQAVLLEENLEENYLLGFHRAAPFCKKGKLNRDILRKEVEEALEAFDVRPRDPSALMESLSGGNQQKLVIAREMRRPLKLLVAAQPTRGVDVGAIEAIHKRIVAASRSGTAVLLVSSELDEVMSLSDRILVMFEGEFAAEFSQSQVTERALGVAMGGGQVVEAGA